MTIGSHNENIRSRRIWSEWRGKSTADLLHIITKKTLTDFAAKHADAGVALDSWFRIAKAADWATLVDVQNTFSTADYVAPYTVFNIKGNTYRLIVKIEYKWKRIYIKHVLTHADYDKDEWK